MYMYVYMYIIYIKCCLKENVIFKTELMHESMSVFHIESVSDAIGVGK